MYKKYLLSFLLFTFIMTGIAVADDIQLSATVDRTTIDIGGQIHLTVMVEGSSGSIPNPTVPPIDGFSLYSSGRSQNISIINGKMSSNISFTYVLVPTDTGQFTIKPITLRYNGKIYQTQPIMVNVTKGAASSSVQNAPLTAPGGQPHGKEIFIETYVDKLRAYVNEQITLTFAFYQAIQLFDNPVYTPPSTRGFWAEDMPPQNKYYKTVNGTRYLVTEIKTALFPTQPGEYIVGSAHLEVSVQKLEDFFGRDPFSIFGRDPFSMFRQGQPVRLTTDPIKIAVLPLPQANKPANFKGDVGMYDIAASIDKTAAKVGDPIALTIEVAGTGNIKTISEPDYSGLSNFKVYDSASSENVTKENYIVGGKKVFEKVLIPTVAGQQTIAPIEYSFFDPSTKQYARVQTQPFTLTITAAPEEERAMMVYGSPDKKEIAVVGRDIRYIKTNAGLLADHGGLLYKQPFFILFILLFPLIFIISFFMVRHQDRLVADIGYARARRAKRVAVQRMKKARSLLREDSKDLFYQEMYRGVAEYLADKLNIPSGGLTTDEINRHLERLGFSSDMRDQLSEVLRECDHARFASTNTSLAQMQSSLQAVERILIQFERSSLW